MAPDPKKNKVKIGANVWVRDQDVNNPDVFVLAKLQGIAGRNCQVQVVATKECFETDAYFPANPPDQLHSDHTALLHLSDATLLANTKARYIEDDIYTYVGPILVSVNPFKYIPRLYAPDLMNECKKFAPGHPERPAHTFSMAEAAFRQLAKTGTSQSLVVSGESGAGKTEVNKQCMNYLTWRASAEHSDLATRILQSNPILEALGNAKTVRNNNSSRFGKYVTMRFSEKHEITGAQVQTFLLEKSRVVSTTATGERNYHLFYYVLKGSGILDSDEPMDYRLLNRSSCVAIPRVDDAEEHQGVVQALIDIGMQEEEILEVQEAICALLCLGSIEFGDEDDSQASPPYRRSLFDHLSAPLLFS